MSDRLWAPWRMEFVGRDQGQEPDPRCLFCRVAEDAEDARNYVLARNQRALLMLNAYPYTSGHLMAAPIRHTADFPSLTPEEIQDVMALAQQGMRALASVYRPHGHNVGLNLGSAAGAGIADHLHVHVVPRWVGDANFMTSVGEVRVLPESLDATYQRVLAALRQAGADAR